MVNAQFVKLANGNYLNLRFTTSMYATGGGSSWVIEAAGGEAGQIVLGTVDTPVFTTEAKAQQFIQQILGGIDPNTYIDL